MTKIKILTEEAQLTDSQGWGYFGEESRPDYVMPQIMNLLYTSELEEELDRYNMLSLAAYVSNVAAFDDLTPERLGELWEECQENFQGSFSNEGEFAETFLNDVGLVDEEATRNLVIDWQGTYDYTLRYDYFNVYVYAQNQNTNAVVVDRYFFRSC